MNFFGKLRLLLLVLVHLIVNCVATSISTACDKRQFQCDDGQCVKMVFVCDGRFTDCDDVSDEDKCNSENYPRCKKGFFQCLSDKHCISAQGRCDGNPQCEDDSDEENCPERLCLEFKEFECLKNRRCVDIAERCDGEIDCEDGSDEQNCNLFSRNCYNMHFSCAEGEHCILREWLCDGENDCDDGSDEKNCGSVSSAFTTKATNLPRTTEQLCPGNYCMQNEDCVAIKGQYYCSCLPPFTGEKCELRITAERNFHDLGLVIGILVTLIFLFIVTSLMFFCYYKRRTARNSTALISKSESQMPFTSYSKG